MCWDGFSTSNIITSKIVWKTWQEYGRRKEFVNKFECEEIILRGRLKFALRYSCKQSYFNQILKGIERMKISNEVSKQGIKY